MPRRQFVKADSVKTERKIRGKLNAPQVHPRVEQQLKKIQDPDARYWN